MHGHANINKSLPFGFPDWNLVCTYLSHLRAPPPVQPSLFWLLGTKLVEYYILWASP